MTYDTARLLLVEEVGVPAHYQCDISGVLEIGRMIPWLVDHITYVGTSAREHENYPLEIDIHSAMC